MSSTHLTDMSREDLEALVIAQATDLAKLRMSREVTNKQVYTAIRNYVANELGLGNAEIHELIKAAIAPALDRILMSEGSGSVMERIAKRVDSTVDRLARDEVHTQVNEYMRRKLAGYLRVNVQFDQVQSKE